MSKPSHSGPQHDRDCLAGSTSGAACRCQRAEWLGETVTRAQARDELLRQLAGWATERRVLESGAVEAAGAAQFGRNAGTAAYFANMGAQTAARIAHEVYAGITATATGMRKECAPILVAHPATEDDATTGQAA